MSELVDETNESGKPNDTYWICSFLALHIYS